jgi:hypothetical protein
MQNRLARNATLATLLLVFAGVLAACASSGERRQRSDPTELSREEIMSVEARNLYDVVRRLRPRWLNASRRAGERSFGLETRIVVYQGQTYLGDVEVLGDWSPSAAYKLEWLDGPRASATLPGLGSQHVAGAIIIRTRPEN